MTMVACGLHWLPIAAFIVLPSTFIISFAIAVVLGHVEPSFPYISDTGALPPESCVFGQLLNISAVLVGLIVYVKYRQVEEILQDNRRLLTANKVALGFGIASALGISIVGNFQESNVLVVHLIGAVMAFGLGGVYGWIQSVLSFHMCPFVVNKSLCFLRVALCAIVTATFCLTFIFDGIARHHYRGHNPRKWYPGDGGYHLHVASTGSEWILAISMLIYFLTFIGEFRRIHFVPPRITLIEDDHVSGLYIGDDEVVT